MNESAMLDKVREFKHMDLNQLCDRAGILPHHQMSEGLTTLVLYLFTEIFEAGLDYE